MKEKHDVERRYDDLFSSYATLLEHNNTLVKKIEALESERDTYSTQKTYQSNHSAHSHAPVEHDIGHQFYQNSVSGSSQVDIMNSSNPRHFVSQNLGSTGHH